MVEKLALQEIIRTTPSLCNWKLSEKSHELCASCEGYGVRMGRDGTPIKCSDNVYYPVERMADRISESTNYQTESISPAQSPVDFISQRLQ